MAGGCRLLPSYLVVLLRNYLVNYCACVIMQVSKEMGVKMEDKNNMNILRLNSWGGVDF